MNASWFLVLKVQLSVWTALPITTLYMIHQQTSSALSNQSSAVQMTHPQKAARASDWLSAFFVRRPITSFVVLMPSQECRPFALPSTPIPMWERKVHDRYRSILTSQHSALRLLLYGNQLMYDILSAFHREHYPLSPPFTVALTDW